MISQNKTLVFLITIFTLMFIFSCSRKTLSLFLDGVPNKSESDLDVTPNSTDTKSIYSLKQDSNNIPINIIIVHSPYQEKGCSLCHDENSMGKLNQEQPELCFSCHDNFNELYRNIHAAIEFVTCTECHHPHKSKNDYLLKEEMPEMCFTCHDDFTLLKHIHAPVSEGCSDCHNPHGSDHSFLLSMEEEGFCYSCHEEYSAGGGSLHAPVR